MRSRTLKILFYFTKIDEISALEKLISKPSVLILSKTV